MFDWVALAVAPPPDVADGGRAGGTWYDVAATDEGHVWIVVGDARAAPAGVAEQLHAAAAGVGRRSAAAALDELDRAAREIPGSVGCTALCVTLGPSGLVRWSSAGYAPPVALGPGGARSLLGAPGAPLGLPDRPSFAQDEAALPAGTTLVLGSGSPGRSGGAAVGGPDPFAAAVAQHHGLSPDALATALAAPASGASPAGRGPIVVARLMPAPLRERLPADPRRLAAVRRTVAAWSAQAALSDDATADLQLLLSEAATNAVEHAYRERGSGEFVYSVRRRPDAGIRVTVEDFGRWQQPPDDPGYRGRGLAVIHNLADEVSLEHSDRGTRIAFTVPGQVRSLDGTPLAGVTQGWAPSGGRGAEDVR